MLMLPTEITHTSAAACARMLAQNTAKQEQTVVADASSLSVFDSSALAVLLDCRREALRLGKSFAVHQLPERLKSLASLYGVSELLPAAA